MAEQGMRIKRNVMMVVVEVLVLLWGPRLQFFLSLLLWFLLFFFSEEGTVTVQPVNHPNLFIEISFADAKCYQKHKRLLKFGRVLHA